ncbi:hypothetical protein EFK68_03530 [Pseudomonas aeruginosa]|uniref:hypothetical protein n=1 Tax=Pseudomonas aeruginosa TaxID=287 RepID=UPI000F6B04A1|nr:hypothetical protein [Pseudomonas aeruginosa]EKF7416824.1 hypothetical protein [Pseudomonas aeruginosa]EKV3003619.1 hypothetical protein [Pseudomonas aeruginosa]RNF58461.1 hypothetical protein EFK68_03530 [Pseudomonas aeruginosa]CAI9794832.1 DUF1330 domain-containing protein [Pseudomonas aeruginosa]CAI9912221.1 DUF1330 domain-containing protein [Pseudomonas aeruginosa]
MALTPVQQAHVDGVFPECRARMADYLERGVEVVVSRQIECGDDVPPFSVAPKEDLDFWIGCWDTPELASAEAISLGLRVAQN